MANGRRRWIVGVAPWAILIVAKLWLVGGQRLTAYGSLTIDDQWFVLRASWITAGHWLGPFDVHTLIKQPGYPMFVAAVHAVRVPLLLAHQLAYVFVHRGDARRPATVAADPPTQVVGLRCVALQPDDDEHSDLGAGRSLRGVPGVDDPAAGVHGRAGLVVRSPASVDGCVGRRRIDDTRRAVAGA